MVSKLAGLREERVPELLKVPGWEAFPWLRHGFSDRWGGMSTVYGGRTLNLGMTLEDDPAVVRDNRRLLVAAAGGGTLVNTRQIHSCVIQTVGEGTMRELGPGDALVTAERGILLGVLAADCVPVLMADVRLRVVAAVHAGWRGTVAGIAERGVEALVHEFGSRPRDILAAIGPSIGPCCYMVGDVVRQAFADRPGGAGGLFDGERLNLWEANRRQLQGAGVPSSQVRVLGRCTGCAQTAGGERQYFSHRLEGGVTGRMMGVVGVAER